MLFSYNQKRLFHKVRILLGILFEILLSVLLMMPLFVLVICDHMLSMTNGASICIIGLMMDSGICVICASCGINISFCSPKIWWRILSPSFCSVCSSSCGVSFVERSPWWSLISACMSDSSPGVVLALLRICSPRRGTALSITVWIVALSFGVLWIDGLLSLSLMWLLVSDESKWFKKSMIV